jgi:hypothetical protein
MDERVTGLHSTPGGGERPARAATLDSVVVRGADVGLLEVVAAPRGFDVPVGKPIVLTGPESAIVEPDDLILAVGVHPQEPSAMALLQEAGDRGAAAVAFGRDSDNLVEAAGATGVALLRVTPQTGWDQVYALVEAMVAAAGERADDKDDWGSGDLWTLANAIAAMVGAPVTIEDRNSRLLAYSSPPSSTPDLDEVYRATIHERETPETWRRRFEDAGIFAHVVASEAPLWVDQFVELGLRRRLVIAVRAGSDLLGRIWVAEGDKPLSSGSESALIEASRIAATHMARLYGIEQIERRERGQLLRAMLEGRRSAEVFRSRFGMSAPGHCAVLAFQPAEQPDQASRDRLLDVVALRCETFDRHAASVAIRNTVYALVRVPRMDVGALRTLASDLVDVAARALRQPLYAGIGGIVGDPLKASVSRREAELAVEALAREESALTVATYDDVSASVVMEELRNLVREWAPPNLPGLQAAREHDAKHGSGYIATLAAYFETFGDLPAMAKQLDLHPNTVRYRRRRLVEGFGLDLDDPDERLAIELALILWKW